MGESPIMKFSVSTASGEVIDYEGQLKVGNFSGVLSIKTDNGGYVLVSPNAWDSVEVTDPPPHLHLV
jgi:hypothetical protein